MAPDIRLRFEDAVAEDAAEIAALRTEAATSLTARFGAGHWSGEATERGVLASMRHARIIAARRGTRIVGVARLATKKPWAIDIRCFTPCRRPLYLTDMAVLPQMQGKGVGRRMLDECLRRVLEWPGDAVRLDAYDAPAGAGGFYAAYGFVERGRVSYRGTPLIYFERILA